MSRTRSDAAAREILHVGIELEPDARDFDVVAWLESLRFERTEDSDPS